MPPKPKTSYLTNASLLVEINKSKASYSSFTRLEYADYDCIVTDLSEITPDRVAALQISKAAALTTANRARLRRSGVREPTISAALIKPADIDPNGLIFHAMSTAHIPPSTAPTRVRGRILPHIRTSFPPFSHWKFDDGQLVEVGRSHWIGSLSNGHFMDGHGRLTSELGKMFLLLAERYGRRANWRNYSYLSDMQSAAITQLCAVALQFNESRSDNPFAYFTTIMRNCFVRTHNQEAKVRDLRDDLLMEAGLDPSSTRMIDNELTAAFQTSETPAAGDS